MLMPKKIKHRKAFRGKMSGTAQRGYSLAFGSFGIKALDRSWITARQIEAARRAMTRYIRREGQVWIRVFPDKPVTATPAEVGMGGGKGSVDHFVAVVKPGTIIFEMTGVPRDTAFEAMRLAAHKLPLKTKLVEKS